MTTACCQRQPETFNTITNLKPLQTQVGRAFMPDVFSYGV
ncbi:hypothetical protein GCWU000324_02182 [Kingella oralis ATCC 51147]|uniref:Uncharacterized protein n=1 Tax=Kingella oralis ATCC 51147 TaxID=629741 RepID=C4GJF9_9NEIS|nr:hypothetical protein GCWU000324_02182 [Kingella oralis ATCC 51147]